MILAEERTQPAGRCKDGLTTGQGLILTSTDRQQGALFSLPAVIMPNTDVTTPDATAHVTNEQEKKSNFSCYNKFICHHSCKYCSSKALK